MKQSLLTMLWIIGLIGFALPLTAETFLVKDGQPNSRIVIGENPGRAAKFAATELQTHIEKMSGARLPVVARPGDEVPVNIYLGKNACANRPELSADDLKHGAFRMKSGDGWLALLGNDREFTPKEPWPRKRGDKTRVEQEWDKITGDTFAYPYWRLYGQYNETFDLWDFDDRGTINAVHEFLREQGVRWYFPGDLGTIIPAKKSIELPEVNRVVEADFPMRGMYFFNANTYPEVFLYQTRLGFNYPRDLLGMAQVCHGTKFVTMRDEMKKAHPEIFRQTATGRATDHKKGQGSPCISSPLFYQKHRAFAHAMFDYFQSPMLSIDVNDGFDTCQCDLCAGTTKPERGIDGYLSDHVWGYINRLARDLYQTHPEHKVSGLSYGRYRNLPEGIEKLSPNLTLVYCQHRNVFGDPEIRKKFVDRRNAWQEILTSKSFYTFDFHLLNKPESAWAGVPAYFPRQIAEDLRSLKGKSLGDFISVGYPAHPDRFPWDALAVDHLNNYVTSRCYWDAELNYDTLLNEYCRDLYGPAAEAMKTYIEYCSENWRNMLSQAEPITQSQQLLQKARQTAGDSIYGQRIDKVSTYTARLEEIRSRLTRDRENIPATRALPRMPADLTIDGKLDDVFWKQTRQPRLRNAQTGKKPRVGTRFNIAWAKDGALCLGIRCDEPDMANLAICTTENNDAVIRDGDFVDILIETQVHSWYQITINPSGAITDLSRGPGKTKNHQWNSNAEMVVHRGEDHWTAEIRLPNGGPMAAEVDPDVGIAGRLPSGANPWYINVCRQRIRGKEVELSAWSPTGTEKFSVPEKFGEIYIKPIR
ncbi:MAG: DUF4838 domain-containing protein [Verrucomicrobiales bacterium]|nr:DUF4838 domain-containing protein [Verrucomicrobiales bacterium]